MIAVLGSINIDLVVTADRFPRPGETVAGSSCRTEPGGKGANQALAAHRAGAAVHIVGAVGRDIFAKPALSVLEMAGLDTSQVTEVDGATGTAMILVGEDAENMITVVAGANSSVDEQLAARCVESMNCGDILLLQLEIPSKAVLKALSDARARGVRTILNIAPATEELDEMARQADIIIANETEFAQLVKREVSSTESVVSALEAYHRTSGQTVVVTLGSKGVVAITDGMTIRAAAHAITAVDTVGAGDTFCGYFAAGLARGDGFERSLQEASVAASLACTRQGAQSAIPQRSEVMKHFGT